MIAGNDNLISLKKDRRQTFDTLPNRVAYQVKQWYKRFKLRRGPPTQYRPSNTLPLSIIIQQLLTTIIEHIPFRLKCYLNTVDVLVPVDVHDS